MNVLIIGSSSGLGAAIALQHAERKHQITVVGRRSERLQALQDFAGKDATWTSLTLDIESGDELMRLKDLVPRPDRVYYCAARIDENDAERTFRLNVVCAIAVAKTYAAIGSTVILISSLAACIPFPTLPIYCASKAALEHWAITSREAMKGDIVVVRPGQFDSEILGEKTQFNHAKLPHHVALAVLEHIERRRLTIITLGGWRDVVAAMASSFIGGRLARRLFL